VPITVRPGSLLEPVDLDDERRKLDEGHEHPISSLDLASYLMYPNVFTEFRRHREPYGDVGVLPTHVYFYGMRPEEELVATMDDGREVVIRHLTTGETDNRGFRRVFFEINGQPSSVLVQDRSSESAHRENEQADSTNPNHVGAPMPGVVTTITIEAGQDVQRGDTLLTMEAMKMESSITAERDARVKRVLARIGEQFDAKDLLVELE
jgi:pyruvate carboxylase